MSITRPQYIYSVHLCPILFQGPEQMTTDHGAAGRPTSFSREDAVERAMQLFWRDGYLAVTARDLAKAMKIQRSSFYNTFGTKEAVFKEALDRYVRSAPDAALDDIDADQPVIPALVSVLRNLCRVRTLDLEGRGCLVCNSVAELVGIDGELGGLLDNAIKHRIEVMEALFAQAEKRGEFKPPASIADTARAFVTFLIGINIGSKSIRSFDELWGICRIFLLGLGIEESQLKEAKRDDSRKRGGPGKLDSAISGNRA
jgi:TetR/AcrR family transcriptional repressor of nem operon